MENKSLVSIVSEVNQLEKMLIEAGGEITPEIEALLTVKEVNLPQKVDNYSFILERMKSAEAFYKERSELFSSAARAFKNAQATLKERLKMAMHEMGVDELSGEEIRFKLSKSKPSLVIDELAAIPTEYFEQVVQNELQKDKLTEDLKIGEVPGAHLEDSFSLRSYANSPKSAKKGGKNE